MPSKVVRGRGLVSARRSSSVLILHCYFYYSTIISIIVAITCIISRHKIAVRVSIYVLIHLRRNNFDKISGEHPQVLGQIIKLSSWVNAQWLYVHNFYYVLDAINISSCGRCFLFHTWDKVMCPFLVKYFDMRHMPKWHPTNVRLPWTSWRLLKRTWKPWLFYWRIRLRSTLFFSCFTESLRRALFSRNNISWTSSASIWSTPFSGIWDSRRQRRRLKAKQVIPLIILIISCRYNYFYYVNYFISL